MSSIILEAKSLTKEYKQTLALDHINLQIKKGKIYGFIGQNGAGKTIPYTSITHIWMFIMNLCNGIGYAFIKIIIITIYMT